MLDNSDLDAVLDERGTRYGDFVGHARVTQGIKAAMQRSSNWSGLRDCQKEALDMVAMKIGRILNGDPEYHDSWFDILGYVRLVERSLPREKSSRKRAETPEHNVPEYCVPRQLELPLDDPKQDGAIVYGAKGQRLAGR